MERITRFIVLNWKIAAFAVLEAILFYFSITQPKFGLSFFTYSFIAFIVIFNEGYIYPLVLVMFAVTLISLYLNLPNLYNPAAEVAIYLIFGKLVWIIVEPLLEALNKKFKFLKP